MALKDLTEYLAPDLELKHGGKVYTVKPPTKDVGLKLVALSAVGISAFAGKDGIEQVPAEQRGIVETLRDTDLGELSLGDAYHQMVQDGVPGPHIDMYAIYAMYYWTMGEQVADEWIKMRAGKTAPKAEARARSKSGRSTASGSRKTGSTGSRSTPTTGSRKAQPGDSFKKATPSGGRTSSTTGT